MSEKNQIKVGDRVRIKQGAYYTLTDGEVPVYPSFVGREFIVGREEDSDGDVVVRDEVGGEATHVNPGCLELVDEPKPKTTAGKVQVQVEARIETRFYVGDRDVTDLVEALLRD